MKTAGISYDRAGDGEPLLLLHGTGGWHWSSRSGPNSPRNGQLVAVDLPGHGHSDPPPSDGDHTPVGYAATLADLLDELGIATAHVAGDSVGGWTALELAKLGRARSVVAIAPAGLWARRDPWQCALKLWGMYRLGAPDRTVDRPGAPQRSRPDQTARWDRCEATQSVGGGGPRPHLDLQQHPYLYEAPRADPSRAIPRRRVHRSAGHARMGR